MATSVGQINFGVAIDASRLSAELQRSLAPAMRAAQQRLDRTPLRVRVETEVDTSRLNQQLQTAARNARAAVRVNVEPDFTNFTRQLNAYLQSARGRYSLTIGVDLDTSAALARAAALHRELERQFPRITQEVNVEVDRNGRAASSVGGLSRALGDLTKFGGIGTAIAAGLGAIGGAAGVAAGAIGGLTAALLAVGPAGAAIGATVATGVQGIGDAFKAMTAMSENAGTEAASQAQAVASAQAQVESALEGVEDAQRSLNAAQEDSARAAEDVAQAYKDAERDLQQYRFTVAEANLSEKEAALALKEAQDALRESFRSRDPDDRTRALLKVERAELNLAKAQDRNREVQEEAAEAQRKGVEGSDKVIAAKERQAQADERVVQAEENLARANRQVAQATQALADAQNQALPSVEKFNQAMAKLAPNAQAFVLAAKDLAPVWEEVRKSVQNALFEELDQTLRDLAANVLPTLREGLTEVATELNLGARGFADFLQSANGLEGLEATFDNTRLLLKGMREGSVGFMDSLAALAVGAQPFMENLGRAIGSIGTALGDTFRQMAESGLFQQVLVGMTKALEGLGPLLGDIIMSFTELANRVLPSLQPFFLALGDALVAIAPALGDLGRIFADSLTAIMPALSAFISDLAVGLQPILPVIANLLIAVGDAIRPMIPALSQFIQQFGTVLTEVLVALTPALGPLTQAFADMFNAVSPILPVLAQLVATVVQALAPALSLVFEALAPVIQQLADQLKPVFEQLAPILAQTALIIGQALADALVQVAPVLPQLVTAFTNLLLAVAPLLPEFAKLAAEILPPLVRIWVEMTPITIKLIEALTWLVEKVVPIVIDQWQTMGPILSGVLTVIGDAVVFWKDVFKTAFDEVKGFWDDLTSKFDTVKTWFTDTLVPAFEGALNNIKSFFSTILTEIGNIWDGLKEKAAIPINFVIGTVWNNGLLKAWKSIDGLLGNVLPDASELPLIPTRATGGPLSYFGSGGTGNGTKDDILFWGSNGEHVITAAEVMRAGGQNIIYAIRDMIARGIPFTWDNGKVIAQLGRDNLSAYGAAVSQKGIGNVPPEGLFDPLFKKAGQAIPGYASGGPIMPWMYQLKAGHDFAKAQNGKPYQWAGPRFVGDSFDCSGFMGSIIAAILGSNPWQRYWATSSFAGYPAVGAQGLTKGLTGGSGMAVGITDDPGGPGGGHTAGELRGIPELGIAAARVESGGAIGDVHYGRGTDPNSFAALYGLPIGANGFFAPARGGSANAGPSVDEQAGFLRGVVEKMVHAATKPVQAALETMKPPPAWKGIPAASLTALEKGTIDFAVSKVGDLGGLIGGAWQKAQDLGEKVLDFVNPFDAGGIANGTGYMRKDIIAPERVLSPEQTKLFEALVAALQQIAGGAQAFSNTVVDAIGSSIGKVVGDVIGNLVPPPEERPQREEPDTAFMLAQQVTIDEQGRILADTHEMIQRTESTREQVIIAQAEELKKQIQDVANKLTGGVLGPVVQSAMDAALDVVKDLLGAGFDEVTEGTDRTTAAVEGLDLTQPDAGAPPPPFGAPGSAFDAAQAISDAIVSVANTATQAFNRVAQDIANAALAQSRSEVDQSRGVLGRDVSGGPLVDLIVRLTGVEIEIRDTLLDTLEEVKAFRGDSAETFNEAGKIVGDTAELMQRNESSRDLVISEMNRLNRELIKAVLKYLIVSVLLPILTAILGAMIQLAVTAIGAAIGSIIPGIGTAIGLAIGAVVGAALAGVAAIFTSALAIGAGAALDSFDSGGVAYGKGYMPKDTISPERVLSPQQTESFDRLVTALEKQGNRNVYAPMTVYEGPGAGRRINNDLLSLL